ncbi:MAG: carboxyl transferase domain-containing protein [Streptosporangiaceae bacterium]
MLLGAIGEDLTKEELGGASVHRDNGSVERIVPDEPTAFQVIGDFLGYLPGSAFEIPPVVSSDDPPDRRDAGLLGAIPRNPRRPYRIEPVLRAILAGSRRRSGPRSRPAPIPPPRSSGSPRNSSRSPRRSAPPSGSACRT